MARLDPVASRSLSFLFPRCQARLDGADLLVTVPAPRVTARSAGGEPLQWDKARAVEAPGTIGCEEGAPPRRHRSQFPVAGPYGNGLHFRFKGAVWYGRV